MLKNNFINFILGLKRSQKRLLSLTVDFLMIPFVLWLSFSFRLDRLYIPDPHQYWVFLAAPMIAIPIFIRMGLYRAIIRYIGFHALWTVIKSVALYTLLWSLLVLLAKVNGVPRSVYILNFLLAILSIGGSRMVARWIFSGSGLAMSRPGYIQRKNVVIYGAGSAGMQLAVALGMSKELKPIAFIDDNHALHNLHINGLKVHSFSHLSLLIESKAVEEVLLALPSVSNKRRKEIISLLEPYSVHIRTIPGVAEMAQGKVKVEDIREIEISDLLGRDTVEPDIELLNKNIKNKSVMVTGAGGSIGSELCRQIIRHSPTRLILFELSEFQLYAIEKELLKLKTRITIIPILGSVNDKKRVSDVCSAFSVDTIYHAAAYKHVPMVERNPGEAIQNNIFGTLHTAQAAIETGVETFVLISTDKAVRPTNTMGATKRFAELILQALSQDKKLSKGTRFTMVRFGNVLGSSGSVVPLFREQISHGGPVTVTDKNIIRYFMTIPEAAELVIQAGAMGKGGDVFVLDMGEPVHIVELARKMIRLSGFEVKDENTPFGDIEIIYTGLRPGEKLFEELLIGDNITEIDHEKIMRAEEEVIEWNRLALLIQQLKTAKENCDYELIRAVLKAAVSGYNPQCEIVDEVKIALYSKPVSNDSKVVSIQPKSS
jgi:UDP-N-acetylglucosamine 4,6-dehydratase